MVNYLSLALLGTGVVGSWNLYLNYRQRRNCHPGAISSATRQRVREVLKMSDEEIDKAQCYQKDKLTFTMVTGVIDMAVSFGVLGTKLLPLLWTTVQALSGVEMGGFAHGLLFSISMDIMTTCIALPTSYYNHFVLEERHGFNKQTIGTWVKDQLKGFALRVSLLHPITSALFYYAVHYFGPSFPNYLFAGGAVLLIAFMYIFPAVIQPLFNKFTPLPDGSLKTRIDKLAHELKFPLSKVYEIDGSKRSAHSNAYFYGFYNNKRIVLFDTLMKQLEEDEIMAVLCHEFGHWYHNHTVYMMMTGLGQLFVMSHMLKLALYEPKLATDFGFAANTVMLPGGAGQMNPILGFQLFSTAILEPVMAAVSIVMSAASRRYEFQADTFAVGQGYGDSLRTGLVKISKENKGNVNPDWLYAACNYSHPPMLVRLAAVDEQLKKKE